MFPISNFYYGNVTELAFKMRDNDEFYRVIMSSLNYALEDARNALHSSNEETRNKAKNLIIRFGNAYTFWRHMFYDDTSKETPEDGIEHIDDNLDIYEGDSAYPYMRELATRFKTHEGRWILHTIQQALAEAYDDVWDGHRDDWYWRNKMFINSFFEHGDITMQLVRAIHAYHQF